MIGILKGRGTAAEFLCFGELVYPHRSNRDADVSDWLMIPNQFLSSSEPAEWLLAAASVIWSQTLRRNGSCLEYLVEGCGVEGCGVVGKKNLDGFEYQISKRNNNSKQQYSMQYFSTLYCQDEGQNNYMP